MSERPIWRLVAGQKRGPYAPDKLRPLVKDGRISPLDRFSYDGTSWGQATDFPELLREPASAIVTPPSVTDETFGVNLDGDAMLDDFVEPAPVDQDEDEETRRLMKVVYWVIGVGGGLIAILVLLTVFSSVRGGGKPSRPAAPPAAAKRDARPTGERADATTDTPPAVPEAASSEVEDDRAEAATESATETTSDPAE